MNIITHRIYKLEFDVWEPHEKVVNAQMTEVVAFLTAKLKHAARMKLSLATEERVK